MKNRKIVIAGGSGFMGTQLAAMWAKDNEVIILGRNVNNGPDNNYGTHKPLQGTKLVVWDARNTGSWIACLEHCDVLINLAGRTVNCRYTARNKADIMNSRVDATRVLGEAIKQLQHPPKLWINVASATIYRHAEDRPQDEVSGEIENDFSVQVCKAWEAAFNEIALPHTRKIILRMAIVLGKGGVLTPYSWLARLGVGGRQGNGRQMFSWVHITDVARMIEWLCDNEKATGVYNAAAPGPLPNNQFMALLRQQYKMPIGIPAPAWLLKIAALINGTETELLLKSRWVVPARLLTEGFRFKYTGMETALNDLLPLYL